jgi:hypothetical protein
LPHGFGLKVGPPLAPRGKLCPRSEGRAVNRPRQWRALWIFKKGRRVRDDLKNLIAKAQAIISACDELADEVMGVLDRFARRHSEMNQVFGVHE